MGISHFSVLVHGFNKPAIAAGNNFGNTTQRSLYITRGYLNRRLWEIQEYSRGFIRMGNSMRLE